MKALCLISGGIDSPVAAYLMMKQGVELDFVFFDNYPFSCRKGLEKAKKLVARLCKIFDKKLSLYVVPNGRNHEAFLKNCNRKYLCVLCRRMMFRVSELIARKTNADYLVTGENIAQVASQTISNMKTTSSAVKIGILRPLLTNDKNETIALAKEIGTYEISIIPSKCCTHLPNNPATRSDSRKIEAIEKNVDIAKLAEESANNAILHVID